MTERQFKALQESLNNLNATLLAGFGVLAGLQEANSKEKELGRFLSIEEWMTAVHNGLDTVLMLRDNANQELFGDSEESS